MAPGPSQKRPQNKPHRNARPFVAHHPAPPRQNQPVLESTNQILQQGPAPQISTQGGNAIQNTIQNGSSHQQSGQKIHQRKGNRRNNQPKNGHQNPHSQRFTHTSKQPNQGSNAQPQSSIVQGSLASRFNDDSRDSEPNKPLQKHSDARNSTTQQCPPLTALQMILDLTKEWKPRLHYNEQPFVKLPGDLTLCIMDHLKDPVDKVSLALTTKSMWYLSQGILKLEDFNLQQVLPIRVNEQSGTIKPWPYFRSYRWRLLERLENEYWKACAGCLRLHPKTEFFYSELKEPANERYCRAPGLIQICSHLSLTYKKCEALQKALAEQAGEEKCRHQTTDFDKYLYHQCTMRVGASKFTIGTQPFVTNSKQQLVFRQKYTLHINSENWKEDLDRFGSRSLFPNLCPHRSIITHCMDLLDEKSPWTSDMIIKDESDDKANVTCKGCLTYFCGFRRYVHSTSQKLRIDFFTSRTLGNGNDFGLQECKIGHGIANELQSWIDKTHLASIVDVTDTVHYGCKCRRKCRKLGYMSISCPSARTSLPDTTWKGERPMWPY